MADRVLDARPSIRRSKDLDEQEYLHADGVGLAERIRSGILDERAVHRVARARLERLAPELAFLAHDFSERPRAGAASGQEDGPWGPFFGVPFLLKDELELEGTPLSLGCRLLEAHVCERTHPVITGFLRAGLRPMGRTTMSELGLLPTTEPLTTPPTKNPWNLEYSPGGSSGGAAAAVAAGVVPLAHAADGGGSIRVPASACGLVGLKPSRGRHPIAAMDPPFGFVSQHCVSRTVRDSAALLDVLSSSTPGRYWVPPPKMSFRRAADTAPAPLRIGVTYRGVYDERFHPEVEAALRRTAGRLEGLGHRVDVVDPPFPAEELGLAFGVLWAAAAGVLLRLVTRVLEDTAQGPLARAILKRRTALRRMLTLPNRSGPRIQRFTRWLIMRDEDFTPSELWLAHLVFGDLAERLAQWFRGGYDLWLTPTLTRPPMQIGELAIDSTLPPYRSFWRRPHRTSRQTRAFPANPDDEAIERRLLGYVGFTPVANVTGLPAISLPMGTSKEGLPMGLHFLGPVGGEERLISIAGQWERAHQWPTLAPSYR